jgi:hypothetical protein
MKPYNLFFDKFGNKYAFDNYLAFASFWFGLIRKQAIEYFPDNFRFKLSTKIK